MFADLRQKLAAIGHVALEQPLQSHPNPLLQCLLCTTRLILRLRRVNALIQGVSPQVLTQTTGLVKLAQGCKLDLQTLPMLLDCHLARAKYEKDFSLMHVGVGMTAREEPERGMGETNKMGMIPAAQEPEHDAYPFHDAWDAYLEDV